MKKIISLAGMVIAMLLSQQALAQNFTVKIDNLTHGIFFTPLLVSAHPATTHLFQAGTAASASLQAMAEAGNITGLTTDLNAIGDDVNNFVSIHRGVITALDGLTTSALNESHRFDNPAIRINIRRIS